MRSTGVLCALVVLALAPPRAAARPAAAPPAAPAYDLDVRVLPDEHRLEASGTVRLAAAAAPQEVLPVLLSASMRDPKFEVVEPAACAGPARLQKHGSRGAWGDVWLVFPASPIPAGAPALLRFSYAGGEAGGFTFSLGPEGSFAHGGNAAWYPLFDGGGWVGHVGKMRFSVPSPYVVAATGRDLTSLEELGRGEFSFEVENPSVFSFAVGRFTIAHRAGKPLVSAYLLRPRPNAEAMLEKCAAVLGVLEKNFGPYRHGCFAVVEIPTERAKGFFMASTTGLIFVPTKFLDAAEFDYANFGHETGHQWWGNTLTMKGPKGATLFSEGMAQLGALLVVEALVGPEAAERMRRSGTTSEVGSYALDTCLGYPVPVQSTYGYLMMTASGLDCRLDSLAGCSVAHPIATNKGALALDLLSRTVGRERFAKALAGLVREHAFREVTWEEFLGAVSAEAREDPSWFYAQWFERAGAPDWSVAWAQEGGTLRVTVAQPEPAYRAAVEVLVEGAGAGERRVETAELAGARAELSWPVGFRVRAVTLDPRFLVPHWTPEYRAEAAAVRLCASASTPEEYAKAEAGLRAALAAPARPDDRGERFFLELGLANALAAEGKTDDARAALERAVASPDAPARALAWAHYALARLAKQRGDAAALRRAVDAAVAADAAEGARTGAGAKARELLAN